ncbi:MAG: AAA family ATPase [Gemmatimonadota bacterium]|nr:MAG: AAA family ATPase [Gemmatimonadota bacterium]
MVASEHEEAGRLVARATELTQLDRILQDLRSPQGARGRIVVLSGATGVGKTALAKAFVDRITAADPSAVVLQARCIEEQTPYRPYGPFRDVLAELMGMSGDATLAAMVRKAVTGWMPGAAPSPGRNALFDQFIALCRAITRQRVLVLFIDDLQWSDRSSIDLLARLGATLGSLPVLVLTTYEASESAGTISIKPIEHRLGSTVVELAVRELEEDAVMKLAEGLLEGSYGEDFGAWLAGGARGNALRAEQLLRWLLERQILRKRLFKYSVRESELPNPDAKIESVIASRLDSLEPNTRWTLEAAALCGSVIDSTVVAAQAGKQAGEVLAQLQAAEERHGLIRTIGERQWATGSRSVRFRFRHPLVRRVIRSRVSGKRRAHLLSRAAETLEKLAGAGSKEIADEIAILYLAAESAAKKYEWALKAADLAERLYALYEVDEYLRTAAQNCEDNLERLKIQNRLARIYAATDREPEAEVLLRDVYEQARGLGDTGTEAAAGVMLGWLLLERGVEPYEVSALAGGMVDRARSEEMSEELVMALDLSCVVAERIGRAEEALLMAEEALYVAEQSGAAETVAQAAYRLARVHVSWGSPEDGRKLAQRALEVFGQVDELGGVAVCHDLLGLANFRAGEWDGALHHWQSALESMEVAGVADQKIAMQANIAELLTLRGEFDRAQHLFNSGLQLAEELDDSSLALRCKTGIARLQFERGEYHAVLETTEDVRKVLPPSGAWKTDFQTTAIRALSYLELGDELQAWQEAARLEQLYQGKEGWFERRGEGDAVRIRVIDLDSDAWLAGMVAQQGIGETTDTDPYGEGFLQYHQAQVLARAKPAEAHVAAQRAVELFEQLGAQPMLTRARQLLEELPAVDPAADGAAGQDSSDDKIDAWFDSLEG